MKSQSHRIARCLTLAAAAAGAGWSTASYACSAEDYLSTICVLAAPSNDWRGYAPADGRLMSIAQNSALFALIGTTYGGDGQNTFALPDLRGRFLLGAGNSPSVGNYVPGQISGTPTVTLTVNQIPAHMHALAVPLTLTGLTGTANLGAVTGGTSTVSMTGVTYTANATGLRLQATATNATTTAPTDAYLAVSSSPPNRVYASGTPALVSMAAGSITGAVTVTSSGSPTVALAGNAPVAITGSATATGNTGPTGGTQPFSIMPPYVAMYYMIAVNGIFPSRN
jgi:microcystin-dependent protein